MKKVVKKKKIVRRQSKKSGIFSWLFKGGAHNGALYAIAALAIVATFGGIMAGGALPQIQSLRTPPDPAPPYECCDTGSGSNCHPILDKQVIYNGEAYALLKSKIFQAESGHIYPSSSFTPDGRRIFLNSSNRTAKYTIPGCEQGKDLIGLQDPTKKWGGCFGVPDEMLIYVCSDTSEECNKMVNVGKVPFDVYFRIKDGEVPYEIANYCPKPKVNISATQQQVVMLPTPSGTANLQLETFTVKQQKTSNKWLGAWCKPADYFYPTEKTDISFDVKPQGEFVVTIPQYTKGGWNFTAYPDGRIVHQGRNYPYIYWEAAIPNSLITEPKEGFSVSYNNLTQFLTDLMPKMGLNTKEAKDFTDYWSKQLPKSNYYFIGIIPQKQTNDLAPLSISPEPDSILRVSLFFKPLKENISVTAPVVTSFERKGFTVVEWGGLFDTQKHPGFSCLM